MSPRNAPLMQSFHRSTITIKTKGDPKDLLLFLWRRQRDSNPRGEAPNGFQDRLVMTTSICLHIQLCFGGYAKRFSRLVPAAVA